MSTYVTGDTRGAFGGILSYRHWFCGHYHIEMIIDKLQFCVKIIRIFQKKCE